MSEENKYKKLAEELNQAEVRVIELLQNQNRIKDLQLKIEAQAPKLEEIISQYSTQNYVVQDIEIMPGLKCTFRTLPPGLVDEAITYANRVSESDDVYGRTLARRRLAHGLLSINGKEVADVDPVENWAALLSMPDSNLHEKMVENASKRMAFLNMNFLADKISEAYGVWETVIFNRINGIDDLGEALKNSTGT